MSCGVEVLTSTGQFVERVFACRLYYSSNETTHLRTDDTERNTLNPIAKTNMFRVVHVVFGGQGVDEVWCMLRQYL